MLYLSTPREDEGTCELPIREDPVSICLMGRFGALIHLAGILEYMAILPLARTQFLPFSQFRKRRSVP